jgi:hypothetical protein
MAYDAQQHDVARGYLDRALRFAAAADDQAFSAEVLAGTSHQAIHLGQLREALELARAAQHSAERAGIPALLAKAHVMEAHSHARSGDARSCALAVHRAEVAFDRPGRGQEPEWLAYFDEPYLAAKLAHCFRDLAQWRHAERFARHALQMNDRLARARTFNTALLATTYVENDLDQACAVCMDAIDLASRLHSGRSVQYVRDLGQRLSTRHPGHALVDRFQERVHDVFGGKR